MTAQPNSWREILGFFIIHMFGLVVLTTVWIKSQPHIIAGFLMWVTHPLFLKAAMCLSEYSYQENATLYDLKGTWNYFKKDSNSIPSFPEKIGLDILFWLSFGLFMALVFPPFLYWFGACCYSRIFLKITHERLVAKKEANPDYWTFYSEAYEKHPEISRNNPPHTAWAALFAWAAVCMLFFLIL